MNKKKKKNEKELCSEEQYNPNNSFKANKMLW